MVTRTREAGTFNAADDTPIGTLNLCPTEELSDFEESFLHALSAGSTAISNGKTFVCTAFYPRSDSAEKTTDIIITGQFGKVVKCLAAQSSLRKFTLLAQRASLRTSVRFHQSRSLEQNTISIAHAE